MRRWFKHIGVAGLALALVGSGYLKGHFDGARQASMDALYLDTVIFRDFAKSAESAQSRCGMLIAANYDSLKSPFAAIKDWWRWLTADKADRWRRLEARAAPIADQYRRKIPTLDDAKASLEKAFPGAHVEFKPK